MAFDWRTLSPAARLGLIAGGAAGAVALIGGGVWLARGRPETGAPTAAATAGAGGVVAAASPVPAVPSGTLSVPPQGGAAGGATAGSESVEDEPESKRTTARITFTVIPPVAASVTWGRTRLGQIRPRQSLVVTRPRDSGPLDVIVRASGYLPVHTRAHTFGDSRVVVRLTTLEQKSTLLGYRVPLDAGTSEIADSGEPELAPTID